MHRSKGRDLLILVAFVMISSACASEFVDCTNSDNQIACRGVNFLTKAFSQVVASGETVKLLPGLEIVQNDNINKVGNVNDERSLPEPNNETIFSRIAKYLQTHDLKIKFSDMVGKTDLQDVVNNVFNNDDPAVVGKLIRKAKTFTRSFVGLLRIKPCRQMRRKRPNHLEDVGALVG